MILTKGNPAQRRSNRQVDCGDGGCGRAGHRTDAEEEEMGAGRATILHPSANIKHHLRGCPERVASNPGVGEGTELGAVVPRSA